MTTDFRALCAELLQALTTTNPSAFGKFAELEDRARAALAQPEPADGEVAELVTWLRVRGQERETLHLPGAALSKQLRTAPFLLTRAADLLERLSPPQPIPVSERLPGPGDCDAKGRCWIGRPEYTFPMGDTGSWGHADPEWCLEEPREAANSTAVWLPAHALPVPADD